MEILFEIYLKFQNLVILLKFVTFEDLIKL